MNNDRLNKVQTILKERMSEQNAEVLAEQLLRGAENGSEIDNAHDFDTWLEKRFLYQMTWLDKGDYARALIRALWLAPNFAGTDFGSSRQRDFGQVWTDTARGFMGEIGFQNFLANKFGTTLKFDTRRGPVKEFLATDVSGIQKPGESLREPKLTLSIKTTKFNGRWLDLPGAQAEHSRIYVLVKVGVVRAHLLAFFKGNQFPQGQTICRRNTFERAQRK